MFNHTFLFRTAATVLVGMIVAAPLLAEVTTYPQYPNEPASTLFSVTADGKPVFTHSCAGFNSRADYARFAFTGNSVTVAVTLKSGTLGTYQIYPKAYTSTKAGNTFTFTLDQPRKLLIKGLARNLAIFAERPEVDPPKIGDPKATDIRSYNVDTTGNTPITDKINAAINAAAQAGGGTTYFPPGVYNTNTIHMKSNTNLYVAAGALIKSNPVKGGVIRLTNISNVAITGRGTISGAGNEKHILDPELHLRTPGKSDIYSYVALSCKDVVFDGLVLIDSWEWTLVPTDCERFTAKNIKIINEDQYWWDDGFECNMNRNTLFEDGFFYGTDDGLCVKGAPYVLESVRSANDSITFRNMVVHGKANGLRFGFDGETYWAYAKNILFENVHIVSYGHQEAAFKIEASNTTVDNFLRYAPRL